MHSNISHSPEPIYSVFLLAECSWDGSSRDLCHCAHGGTVDVVTVFSKQLFLPDRPDASVFDSLSHAGPVYLYHLNLCFHSRMEAHRLNGSSDSRMQKASPLPHSARKSQENLFGVKVQVQGIKGQPYVVLNSSGHETHKDVSVITHQAGYNPGMVRRSVDGRWSPSETKISTNSSALHYQKHPEILRPYDPENNNLDHITPQNDPRKAGFSAETTRSALVDRPRIPLPVGSPADDLSEVIQSEIPPSGGHVPAQSPSSVETDSIMSVGRLISQFNSNLRRGRGPRNKVDPEALRRSRSVDNSRTSDSSFSSPSSSRSSSLKGIRGETTAGMYPPGSARARLLSRESPLTSTLEESRPNPMLSKDTVSQQTAKVFHRAETLSVSKPHLDQSLESEQRDAPVSSPAFG